MSGTDRAELRGRVVLRPWRVTPVVDTTSLGEVRNAIGWLSSVWGGYYMPILDMNQSVDELKDLGRLYDVDSLYADISQEERSAPSRSSLNDLLNSPGWSWQGRGPWGPFSSDGPLRKGLLETRSVLSPTDKRSAPVWLPSDPLDLFYAATWGSAPNREESHEDAGPQVDEFLAPISIDQLLAGENVRPDEVGLIHASRALLSLRPYTYRHDVEGIYVIRPDRPEDIVEFWNLRSLGSRLIGLPAHGPAPLINHLMKGPLPSRTAKRGGASGSSSFEMLEVWGLEDAGDITAAAIRGAAGSDIELWERPRSERPIFGFLGLATSLSRSFRAPFHPGDMSVDVPLPSLSLQEEPYALSAGIVAAEVSVHSVSGQDPRLTISIPPYRRHSKLLQPMARLEGVDQVRVTGDGIALGVHADANRAAVPFVYNLDAIDLLFDDDRVTVSQSDEGKFQTRAAEMLGGSFSGVLNQPGIRAAIERAGRRNGGVTAEELKNFIRANRGAWPDPLYSFRVTPEQYVEDATKRLLNSGLLVPMMDVHCSFCRVVSQVAPRDLDTEVRCEFCGDESKLAFSMALAKPRWRHRLASHLATERIQALLPALAVASLLRQLRAVESAPLPHVLGLEVAVKGQRPVEVDVAVCIPDAPYTAVLGEVKSGNRIDANDVDNLERLQGRLREKQVPCLLLIGTLNEALRTSEIRLLRQHVERSGKAFVTGHGVLVPAMPLVLTRPDLSLPWGHDDHPWRWGSDEPGQGLFGTAVVSCKKHLGLISYSWERGVDEDELVPRFEWTALEDDDLVVP